jgi:hypothetical protein
MTSCNTTRTHRFLCLKQPISDVDLPCPKLLRGDWTYAFPFTFTVPAGLLPQACPHSASSDAIVESHLRLPPSLDTTSHGAFQNDLAQDGAKISYDINVCITQVQDIDGSVSLLVEESKEVNVQPSFEEQPPLIADLSILEYRWRQEKNIKKSVFRSPFGMLVVEADQPKAIVIPRIMLSSGQPMAATVHVRLRFDPLEDNASPIQLTTMETKIDGAIYLSLLPQQSFPMRYPSRSDRTHGVSRETICRSSFRITPLQWTAHDPVSDPSIGSPECPSFNPLNHAVNLQYNVSNARFPPASKNYRGRRFYTSHLQAPISLPQDVTLLPTFHSCLISRTYRIHICLSTDALTFGKSSLGIKIPVQVGIERGGNTDARNENVVSAGHARGALHQPPGSLHPPLYDG